MGLAIVAWMSESDGDKRETFPWWAPAGYIELPWFFLCWVLMMSTEILPGAWFEPSIEVMLVLGLIPGAGCAWLILQVRRRVLKLQPRGGALGAQLFFGVALGELLAWQLVQFPNRLLDQSAIESVRAECVSVGRTKGGQSRMTIRPTEARWPLRYNVPGTCIPKTVTSLRVRRGALGMAWIP